MQVSKWAGPLAVGVKRYQTELICPWSGCDGLPGLTVCVDGGAGDRAAGTREGDCVHEVVVRGPTAAAEAVVAAAAVAAAEVAAEAAVAEAAEEAGPRPARSSRAAR